MFNKLFGAPVIASEHGAQIDFFLEVCHWFMLILFVGWLIYFVYVLTRFRKGRNPKADYVGVTSHTSSYLEMGVVIVEAVLLLGFAFPLWATRTAQLPNRATSTVVHVIAQQFAWNIHYPGPDGKFGKRVPKLVSDDNPIGIDAQDPDAKDDVITLNQLHLPLKKPAILEITSKDVIHSLTVRPIRITQDAIPGMMIPVWFVPTMTNGEARQAMMKPYSVDRLPMGFVPEKDYLGKDGQPVLKHDEQISAETSAKLKAAGITEVIAAPQNPLEIICAQLCGNSHFRMRGFLTVESQQDFDTWFKQQPTAGQ
jgi:cytochrome c oxidase subunit II